MSVQVEIVRGDAAIREFVGFHDRVYSTRSARWPAESELHLPAVAGEGDFMEDRTIRAFVARERGQVCARVMAVWDARYNHYWKERLGHVALFEALPDAREATVAVMDAACAWLGEQGADAARAGFCWPFDDPFAIDGYEMLPPTTFRQNPAYYHVLLKGAGFESERAWVDYRADVTPERLKEWDAAVEAARGRGFEVVRASQVPEADRVGHFTDTFNETFKNHWGLRPFSESEFEALLETPEPGRPDATVLAYAGDDPVGLVFIIPEDSPNALLAPGRELEDSERVNFLGIGVRERARGQGVNLAMAGFAFRELARFGAKCVGYTLVLDDNWASRRTATNLGAYVCGNYMVYRRNLAR
jgi:hypothetical protein